MSQSEELLVNGYTPSVSVVIPTLNSERTLESCLRSIAEQDYPSELVEVIVADAGSTDRTLEIARRYTDCIYPNPLVTGEAGKAVGLCHARHEIVALIDSDNILPDVNWFRRMVAPFADEGIVGTEPWKYTHRREDGMITRYCALMGMNDPLCLFLGNYDRYSYITKEWTGVPVDNLKDCGDYIKFDVRTDKLPTIGANGFMIRRSLLQQCDVEEYLFDIDVIYELALKGERTYAKVKAGIVHVFSGSVWTFIRKQQRRIRDYRYYNELGLRKYPWRNLEKWRLAQFVVYSVLVFPLLIQALIGYSRKRDVAWFFHPVACILTLVVYGIETTFSLFMKQEYKRRRWSQ